MAQPTFTQTPSTTAFTGTSAPILYKFTSTNYSNAGYRMEVEIWNDLTSSKIAEAKFYTNSSGSGQIDVAPFLRSAMSLNNSSNLTSGNTYTDTNWIRYYIKTQEVWTASSESQQTFSNRFAIYGGLQIGNTNDFTDYVDPTYNFLTIADRCTAIIGYPFLISFKGYINSYMRVVSLKAGSTVSTNNYLVSNDGIIRGKYVESGNVDELQITIVAGGGSLQALASWTNQGTGINWTTGANPSVSVTASGESKYLAGTYNYPSGQQVDIDYDLDVTTTTLGGEMIVYLLNAAFSPVATSSAIPISSVTNYTGTVSLTPSEATYYVAIKIFEGVGVGSVVCDINSMAISSSVVEMSEVKLVDVIEDCQNIVMLQWKNSLGGDECYPFTYNQEYTFDYGNGKKAKRLTLYADNLTLNQWEAIQGLNTTGETYRNTITEMTTSLNRTSSKIGQSVYVLNSDGTKTGVIVINQANTTQTKQQRHSAVVTIEYPEIFLQ